MRIILEKSDIIKLLSKALEAELDPESLVITPEPFEIVISKAEKIMGASPLPSYKKNTKTQTHPDKSVEQLMQENESMIQESLPRQLGRNERLEPPPPTRNGEEE